jgi:hypothetical protein
MCRSIRPRSVSERAGLFCHLAPRQQPPGFRIGKVGVAQFGDRFGLARGLLLGRRVGALDDLAQQLASLVPRLFRGPWRTVMADHVPSLPAVRGAVFEDVAHGSSRTAPRAEARDRALAAVPDDLIQPERPDLS